MVGRFGGMRVVVLGDMALDRFWYGAVQRLSREAPVPIVRLSETRYLPGCAANTVWNVAALGGHAVPVGVLGNDASGDQLFDLFHEAGIDVSGIVREPSWATPTKTRILAGALNGPKQQLARVDVDEVNPVGEGLAARLHAALKAAVEGADALVLSDYGYGLVQASGVEEVLGGVRVSALDSRFDLRPYRGLVTATPNEEEFVEASGGWVEGDEEGLDAAGESLRSRLGLRALLVTRGRRGMCLFEEGKDPLKLPIVGSDQVVDVTGAGDTVMATYVLALSTGAGFAEAAALANVAGGIVVQRHGTATTSAGELSRTLEAWGRGAL